MAVMTPEQLQAVIDRAIVENTTGNITATILNEILTDIVDSVQFPAPVGPPQFREFSIQGVPETVDAGFVLSGNQTFLYNVSNPAGVSGNLTIAQGATDLSTTVPPDETQIVLAVNPNVTFIAGQTVDFIISGTDGVTPFSRTLEITAREDSDYVYYWTAATNAATFPGLPPSTSRIPIESGDQSFVVPSYTGDEFVKIAQPSSESDFSEILIDSVNQIDAFNETPTAFLIDGVNYDVLISENAQPAGTTVGETIVLRRV